MASRVSTLRASLVFLLALAAALLALLVIDPGRGDPPPAGGPPRRAPRHAEAASEPRLPDDAGPVATGDPLEQRQLAAAGRALRCLRAEDRRPLAGVGAYVEAKLVGGTSDANGHLVVSTLRPYGKLVLWCNGWSPVVLELARLPEEALLHPSDATLVVRTLHPDADWHLSRGLLQPRVRPTPPEGPWSPKIREEGPDTYTARSVPPGAYDVYLWLLSTAGDERALSRAQVQLFAGQTTEVTFDLAVPPDDAGEPDR